MNNGCTQELNPSWKNCPSCGSIIPKSNSCKQCQGNIEPNWKVCPNCSHPIESETPSMLEVTDATVGTLNQSVTNINYSSPDQNPHSQTNNTKYCENCGISFLSDKHFLCNNCKKHYCLDCRSPNGQCRVCNPLQTPSEPKALRVRIDRHDATISWSKPDKDGGKPIIKYVIGIKENPNFISETDTTNVVIPDIPEGGPYTFLVHAVNEIGSGKDAIYKPIEIRIPFCKTCQKVLVDNHFLCSECNEASCLDCRSPKGPCLSCNPYKKPSEPRNIKVELDLYNAEISWDEPKDDGGKAVIEYLISIPEIENKSVALELGRYNDLRKILIEEIPEGGPYTAIVTAVNELGESPHGISEAFNITLPHCQLCNSTMLEKNICPKCDGEFGLECISVSGLCNTCYGQSIPGAPISVRSRLLPRNTDDVVVEWQSPKETGETPVTQYIVKCLQDSKIRITVDVGIFKQAQNRKYTKFCTSCATENISDLQYCTGCGEEQQIGESDKVTTNLYSATVHKLKIGKSFSFIVSAVNRNGEGSASEPSEPIKLTGQRLHPLIARLEPGMIITIAGNGKKGFSGDGDIAIQASLNEPYDVAVDELGNIYVADSGNNRIRKISADTGIISTEVGNGVSGFSGDGNNPKLASLDKPRGIDFDSLGNLYIADTENSRIRKVNSASEEITTIAGNGEENYEGNGVKAIESGLGLPESVTIDNHTGYIYVSGRRGGGNKRKIVKLIDDKNIIRNFAGTENGIKPQNCNVANQAEFSINDDIVIQSDHSGGIYLGEQNGHRLYYAASESNKRKLSAGDFSHIAGTGEVTNSVKGPSKPLKVAISPQGLTYHIETNTLYINDGGSVFMGNKVIRKFDINTKKIITIAGNGKKGFEGDGKQAINAKFNKPRGLAVDTYGNLYIADADNNRIRVIRTP